MLEMIRTERVYSAPASGGFRILVDRLWPRGLAKDETRIDLWMKDIAPSNELRKWFGHDPGKWEEFKERFFRELDLRAELVDQLISKAEESDLIFLYAAKDTEHNNAVALKEYLEARMKMPGSLPLDHHSI